MALAHCLPFAALNDAQHAALHAIELDNHIKPWSANQLRACSTNGYAAHAWLDDNLTVLGYAVFMPNGTDWELLNITVARTRQGQGLGSVMLAHGIAGAQAQGVEAVFLEVRASNLVAIAVYERFKFLKVGVRRGYYPSTKPLVQEDAWVMKLHLEAAGALQ